MKLLLFRLASGHALNVVARRPDTRRRQTEARVKENIAPVSIELTPHDRRHIDAASQINVEGDRYREVEEKPPAPL